VLLAIEQGELDAVFTNEDSFARRQDLLQKKIVVPILQNRPSLPGLPLLRDVIPGEHGPLLNLVMSLENFGLPFVGPRDIPAERVDVLRKAFKALFDDKEYQAEAARVHQPIIPPIDGATLASMMNELSAGVTAAIAAAYRRLGAAK
jgi:molybdopterin-guanine dinucleotide biosynthesis protein A